VPTITEVRTVSIDVTDQDRSLAFFTETLGFEKRLEAPMSPTTRWIEVAPRGGMTSIALNTVTAGEDVGTDTGIRFTTPNAAAARASMLEAGVVVGDLLEWPDVPPMFAFDDPDGNRFYLLEEPS
jgi:lactoylglutathione lyase